MLQAQPASKSVPKLGAAALLTVGSLLFAGPATKVPVIDAVGFEKNVKPVLKNSCAACHNATVMSGGVNLLPYAEASTLSTDREAWDKIVQKIESGEMPPRSMPRPPEAQVVALVAFVRGEFMKADA